MGKVDLSRIVNSFQLICISTTWLHSLYRTVIYFIFTFLKNAMIQSDAARELTAPEVVGPFFRAGFIFRASGLQEQTSAPAIDPFGAGWSRGFGILRFALEGSFLGN